MPPRHVYVRTLQQLPPLETAALLDALHLSQPRPADADALAELMLDAYHGTIDDGGETRSEARSEVASYFGSSPPPLLAHSWVCWQAETAVSAALIAVWPARNSPLVAYVMTRAAWKAQRLGQQLVLRSLHSLVAAGYHEARAVITEGNTPSERLFTRLGFAREPG